MAGKTREELRKELGERRVDPATLKGDNALEGELERIRREMEDQPELTPAQEAELEASVTESLKPVSAGPGLAARLAARRQAALAGRQGQQEGPVAAHSVAIAALIHSAYQEFLAHGYEPETARTLTHAYAIAELASSLSQSAVKLVAKL